MQKKNSTDVIILFESSAMIGCCFESILDNYLKPLLQYLFKIYYIRILTNHSSLTITMFSMCMRV
jgi:hypothetical protein